MLLRQRLTSALNHRGHYSAGLAMSALSAGGSENETSAANPPDRSSSMYVPKREISPTFTDLPQSLRSPPVTYPRKTPSNITPPVAGLKDQRWQPSQCILFGPARIASGNGIPTVGDTRIQDFSTIARQSQSPALVPTRPPPARSQQPYFRPYSTTQYRPVNLFMSEEDEDDSFGVDDEELGDILAQCLSCEDASKGPSPAETHIVQDSQRAFEPTAIRRDPGRIKPPLTLKTQSPRSQVTSSPSGQITDRKQPLGTSMSEHKLAKPQSEGITRIKPMLALMTPSRRKPQVKSSPTKQIIGQQPSVSEHKSAEPRSQGIDLKFCFFLCFAVLISLLVSVINSSTNPDSSHTSKIVSSLSGDPNRLTMATGFPNFAPYNIRNPYPHDWDAYKKEEPLISEEYLLSSEISRLAQLPLPKHMDVITPDVKGKMTLDTMLKILDKFRVHEKRIVDCIEEIIDRLITDIRNTKAGSSYIPLFNRLELLEMHDEILDRSTATRSYVHTARRAMLARRDVEKCLETGFEGMSAKEMFQSIAQKDQDEDAIINVLVSRGQLYCAWHTLQRFYSRRQMVGLLERATTETERKVNPAILIVKINALKRLTDVFGGEFPEAVAYKQLVREQYVHGPCVQSAIRVTSSLSSLGFGLVHHKIARAVSDRAGGSGLKRLTLTPAFNHSWTQLEAELWAFTRYQTEKTAYEKKKGANLQDQGKDNSSTPGNLLAKVCEESNKDAVLQRRMVLFRAAGSISGQASGSRAADKLPRKTDASMRSKSVTKRTPPRAPVADRILRKSYGPRSNVSSSMPVQELSNSHKYSDALPSGASSVRMMRTNRSTAHARIRSVGEKTPERQKEVIKITRRRYSNEACRLPRDDPTTSPIPHNSGRKPQMSTSLSSRYGDAIDSNHVSQISEDVSYATQVETTSLAEGHSQPATNHSSPKGPKGFAMSRIRDKPFPNEDSNLRPVYWSYDLYAGPNNEKVKVHYCKSKADTERVAQMFKDENVIGFDIEWKANVQAKDGVRKNVSLIQIASEERVALFHVARFREHESLDTLVAPTFKAIMESPHITKVGVAIKGDCTRLRRFMGIESKGLFELSHLYKLVKYSNGDAGCINKRLVNLATQVEEHLELPLWKGDARTSDWSLDLDLKQVQCK